MNYLTLLLLYTKIR